jgi:hypothetical protein
MQLAQTQPILSEPKPEVLTVHECEHGKVYEFVFESSIQDKVIRNKPTHPKDLRLCVFDPPSGQRIMINMLTGKAECWFKVEGVANTRGKMYVARPDIKLVITDEVS